MHALKKPLAISSTNSAYYDDNAEKYKRKEPLELTTL
jgi:hypothetical protein